MRSDHLEQAKARHAFYALYANPETLTPFAVSVETYLADIGALVDEIADLEEELAQPVRVVEP